MEDGEDFRSPIFPPPDEGEQGLDGEFDETGLHPRNTTAEARSCKIADETDAQWVVSETGSRLEWLLRALEWGMHTTWGGGARLMSGLGHTLWGSEENDDELEYDSASDLPEDYVDERQGRGWDGRRASDTSFATPTGTVVESPGPIPELEGGLNSSELGMETVTGMLLRGGRQSSLKNCWTPAPATSFVVRGKKYLEDSKKIQAEDTMFELVGCDSFEIPEAMRHVAAWEDSVFQRMRRNAQRTGCECPRVLIINWIVPGEPNINHVQYFVEKPFDPITEDDLMFKKMLDHFMAPGNDDFRRKRLKFIPVVVEGPWVVKQAAGAPAIIGKKLEAVYHVGEGYCEIGIDVGSSVVAGKVLGICKGFATSLVIDMGYTIEGKKEAELPERLLGVTRLCYPDVPECDRLGDPITGWTKFTPDTVYETN